MQTPSPSSRDEVTINPKTGLRESWNDRLGVPVVHQLGLQNLRLDGHRSAIHEVPVREVPSLDFYAQLARADTLHVSLQGAVLPGKLRYPSFWRVRSLSERVDAFLAIADPTLQLSDDEKFGLAWYTGGPGWDPLPQLAEIVRQAMDHVGATQLMLLGGSGGGFAAMRLATLFPDSLAFVQDPQTAIAAYNPIHQNRLVASCWPDWNLESVLSQHPERFDLLHLYRETEPQNFIYYRQSTLDGHVKKHCRPFMAALRGTPGMREGRFRFALEEGAKPGHGAITNAEFSRHFRGASKWWGAKLDRRLDSPDQTP